MSGLKSRVVYRRPDGKWVHKRTDRLSATSIHDSKEDAESTARAMLQVFGGGNLTIVDQVAPTSNTPTSGDKAVLANA